MKKLPKDMCQYHSPSRGSICPVCNATYGKCYVSPYEQVLVGYSDPPWTHGKDVAAIFECQSCFEKYWFHLSLGFVQDFEECKKEYGDLESDELNPLSM